jgi:glycosyltransferase involved in cell wall biosynthesis
MSERLSLSVVVPLFDEEENVEPLVGAVQDALDIRASWELILVDDGSGDATPEIGARAAEADARVRLVRLARNYGQTAAMQAGFDQARGSVIVTMDGDLQNDPDDIPRLLTKLNEGYDLVIGYREGRKDRWLTRKVPSWVANRLIGWITGVRIRDNGCSLKAYRRELLERLHLYSDMHRFIPAVAAATAGARIAEIPVRHHSRLRGTSKYGL